MTAKTFYRSYIADDKISPIALQMIYEIQSGCVHAFEFGMGTGKHLKLLQEKKVSTFGIDISIVNCILAHAKVMGTAYGDENYLRHLCNFDCVFCVSVLDHIEHIDGIIQEFQRIANKVIYLIETNDVPAEFYYPHDYESYGFERLHKWKSDGDGATYYLYRWIKVPVTNENHVNDDLCVG